MSPSELIEAELSREPDALLKDPADINRVKKYKTPDLG